MKFGSSTTGFASGACPAIRARWPRLSTFACIETPLLVIPRPRPNWSHRAYRCTSAYPGRRDHRTAFGPGTPQGAGDGNSGGVLDADYIGPVFVSVWNRSAAGSEPIVIEPRRSHRANDVRPRCLRPRFHVRGRIFAPQRPGRRRLRKHGHMKVYVVGAGAVGTFLGESLRAQGTTSPMPPAAR